MLRTTLLAAGVAASALLSGCTHDDVMRIDGVTPYAGDAIAANTVLQMVDPWPYGVQDTDLKVPAERPGDSTAASDAAPISVRGGEGG